MLGREFKQFTQRETIDSQTLEKTAIIGRRHGGADGQPQGRVSALLSRAQRCCRMSYKTRGRITRDVLPQQGLHHTFHFFVEIWQRVANSYQKNELFKQQA